MNYNCIVSRDLYTVFNITAKMRHCNKPSLNCVMAFQSSFLTEMSYSLGRLKQLSPLVKPCKLYVSSFKVNFCNRNVVKTLESRGMLEDVFPKETVHSLGESDDAHTSTGVLIV